MVFGRSLTSRIPNSPARSRLWATNLHATCSTNCLCGYFTTNSNTHFTHKSSGFSRNVKAMAATKPRTSGFSRNVSGVSMVQNPGIKCGPNGTFYVSSGVPDLDQILGGGFPLGSLVMVMEDAEAPHHMLLLRNFMSQGLIHHHPLLYASPSADPRGFLGTLPAPAPSSGDKSRISALEEEKGLRIAWQYKKYFGDNQLGFDGRTDGRQEFCNEFDLRKPLERHFFSEQHVDCLSLKDIPDLAALNERCAAFTSRFPRNDKNSSSGGRIAIQSLCAPQCEYPNMEWATLSFLRSLKAMLHAANAVGFVTFPPSLISSSFCKRLQHMADILLSVRAIPDEDKDLAKLLTGYQDMVGFINIHKVARFNSQVPMILDTTTFSIKLHKRRFLVLERLNQAPAEGSSGASYGTSSSCHRTSKSSSLEF